MNKATFGECATWFVEWAERRKIPGHFIVNEPMSLFPWFKGLLGDISSVGASAMRNICLSLSKDRRGMKWHHLISGTVRHWEHITDIFVESYSLRRRRNLAGKSWSFL